MSVALAGFKPARQGRLIAPKYRLERLLGEGGMASVWLARNVQIDMPVAIKLLRPELVSLELRESLRMEARTSARFVHPAIVRVFDVDEMPSGEPYIVMELLEGESLCARLERGPIPATEAVQLALPIADALCLVHDGGLVHRDIKPENIFLANAQARLQPKLLDFGIAKSTSSVMRPQRRLSRAGNVVGSPGYMSPEQARGAELDQRTDVWSFCVVLHEMLTGHPAFVGETATAVLRSILEDAPAALDERRVDPALARIIFKGLNKDRSARTPSLRRLGVELAEWLCAQGVHQDITGSAIASTWLERPVTGSQTPLPPTPSRSRWRFAFAAAAALSVVGLGAWAAPRRAAPAASTGLVTTAPRSAELIVLAPPPSLCPPVPTDTATAEKPPRAAASPLAKSQAVDVRGEPRPSTARPVEAPRSPAWEANPYGI